MVNKPNRLRSAPYNPFAQDADGDGLVQEGTIWERPGGTRFVNSIGREISAAAARVTPGAYIADEAGNRVDYQQRDAINAPSSMGMPNLAALGTPSIGDTHGTIKDTMGSLQGPPETQQIKPDPRDTV